MKRISAIIGVILVIAMLAAPMAFASGLEVLGTTPANGKTGLQTTNIAVKVKFNQDMTSEANDETNNKLISIKSSDPEEDLEYHFTTVHSSKAPDELWFVLDQGVLKSNTEYTITLDSGIVSTSGDRLANPVDLKIKTRNTSIDSTISMVMMFAMMGIMFFMTSRATKKQEAEADPRVAERYRVEALNPYKIAKEKKISIEEAKAYVKKEREKYQKEVAKYEAEQKKKEAERAAEYAAAQAKIEAELEAQRTEYFYKVKGPKSITLTGREVPKAVIKQKKKTAEMKAAKLRAEQAARDARSKGKKSKK